MSWLSALLSAEIFISTCEWGVQMPPLTSENSHFQRSGPQEATLVMKFISKDSTHNKSVLVQAMAWHLTGDKPLPEPIGTRMLMLYH